jgi:DUF1680 family protein
LTWKAKGLKLRQETAYPAKATTKLIIDSANAESLSLYIRYPGWARSGATVKINGKNIKVNQVPGSYITLNRKWKTGDKVEITYPMALHLEATPDNPKVAAVMYGPIVLAGEMGTEAMPAHAPYHDTTDPYQYYDYDYNIPANLPRSLKINDENVADALKPISGEPLTFKTNNTTNGAQIILEPYYNLHRQRYVVYWDLN